MRSFVFVLAFMASMGSLNSFAHAQGAHAAPPSALDAVLQQHVSATQADRDVVLRLLERPDVRALAGDFGLDLRRAASAVSTLDGDVLRDLASRARAAENALAGGQGSVTISTTMIIIGLLVLILIILIAVAA
jgi:hypothetical protein